MRKMTKPTVEYDSQGESGNIYWIIIAAEKALERQGVELDILTLIEEGAKNYTHALQIISEHVMLVDIRQ